MNKTGKRLKVVLVHPPIPTMTDRKVSPPLGILYLASYIKSKIDDIDFEIIDQNLNEDISVLYCINQVLKKKADVYGISFGTTQYKYAARIGSAIKPKYPDAVIVCGGPHATAMPKETLEDTNCHIIVESEGEETFLELLENIKDSTGSFHDIKGLYYLDENKNMVYTKERPLLENLDDIPLPDRALVNIHDYTRTINGEKATTIITARGCPGRCIFCSQHSWKKETRLRSVENIVQEIDDTIARFNIRNFLFLDDTLTFNRERIFRLCDELKARGVKWRGWTRANMIDEKLVVKMAESNCQVLCVGVESGSQTILNGIKKGTTVEQNRKAIQYIKNSSIYCRISLIVGSPGETWETIQETLDFAVQTQPDDWILSTFVPVPGCESFTNPEKFGIRIKNSTDRLDFYDNFFVVGGKMSSGRVMEYDNLKMSEIARMRDYLYNALMRTSPPRLYTLTGIQ